MISRLAAGIVGSALLALFGTRTVGAQGGDVLAQSQAQGVHTMLEAANVQLAGIGARELSSYLRRDPPLFLGS